jgi:glyoxylase I family protein
VKLGSNATIAGGGFHHVAIRAWDFEKTLAFYQEGLGFVRVYGWGADERASGGKDSRAALLDTGDGNYLEVFAGGTRPPADAPPEGAILHFALRTTNTDEAFARAVAAGGRVQLEPKTVPIAGDTPKEFRIAFVVGPDGEVFEFFQNDEL